MRVHVVIEQRFLGMPDGSVWTPTGGDAAFWKRYGSIFDTVNVVARVQRVRERHASWRRVDGDQVSVSPIPHYVGPWQFLARSLDVRRALRTAVRAEDAVILRIGSQLANSLERALTRRGQPFGVEVIGDPWDVFAPGTIRHPLRPFFRYWFSWRLKRQCERACACAYVTRSTLQRRYPPPDGIPSFSYSDVEIRDEIPLAGERKHARGRQELLMVGTLDQLYKAPDVLLEAVKIAVDRGADLHVRFVGDGRYRPELEALTHALGLEQRIRFLGQIPSGAPIVAELDRSTLFVLPSRTEGLPRALIEAMARGLPCIGSTAGGIPELLSPEDLVPAGDAKALAEKILEMTNDPVRMATAGARNRERAADYRDSALLPKRLQFYTAVREATERWLRSRR